MATDPLQQLDDYLTGHMPDEQATALEDELFKQVASGKGPLAQTLAWLDDMWGKGQQLDALGIFSPFILKADRDRILASGVPTVIRSFDTLHLSLPEAAVVNITEMSCPELAHIDRLDVVGWAVEHPEYKRTFPDVPFDPEGDTVYNCCHAATTRKWPAMATMTQLVGYSNGVPRVLAEYGPIVVGAGPEAKLYE